MTNEQKMSDAFVDINLIASEITLSPMDRLEFIKKIVNSILMKE